jgi:formylglycine-generating enzyme required for sulfatase activity
MQAKLNCSVTVSATTVGKKDPPGYDPGFNKGMEFFAAADATDTCYGTFYRRKGSGSGTAVSKDVRVPVNVSALAIAPTTNLTVKVIGVEMVYIPEGPFFAGGNNTGLLDTGVFRGSTAATYPYWYISADNAMTMSGAAGALYSYAKPSGVNSSAGVYGDDANFTIPAAFPVGYNAFYAMKYEITEQQYVDFINLNVTRVGDARDITGSASGGKNSDAILFRNTVSGDSALMATARPYRAMTYMNSHDWLTYLDWVALRPMSELEFEKMGVGPNYDNSKSGAVFPWGRNFPAPVTGFSAPTATFTGTLGTLELGNELVLKPGRGILAVYNSITFRQGDAGLSTSDNYKKGPVRSGVTAVSDSTRSEAGAGYYGNMDLAGNVWEFVVTVGDTMGIAFTGLHGDGEILTPGFANVTNWPLGCVGGTVCSGTRGVGMRGGSWATEIEQLFTANRQSAAFTDAVGNDRTFDRGGRGVRSCINCL